MGLECKDRVDTFFLARGAIMGLRRHMERPTIAVDGQRRQPKSSQVRFLFFHSHFDCSVDDGRSACHHTVIVRCPLPHAFLLRQLFFWWLATLEALSTIRFLRSSSVKTFLRRLFFSIPNEITSTSIASASLRLPVRWTSRRLSSTVLRKSCGMLGLEALLAAKEQPSRTTSAKQASGISRYGSIGLSPHFPLVLYGTDDRQKKSKTWIPLRDCAAPTRQVWCGGDTNR